MIPSDKLVECIARAICEVDSRAPGPDDRIFLDGRPCKAWEARVPMAEAALLVVCAEELHHAERKALRKLRKDTAFGVISTLIFMIAVIRNPHEWAAWLVFSLFAGATALSIRDLWIQHPVPTVREG